MRRDHGHAVAVLASPDGELGLECVTLRDMLDERNGGKRGLELRDDAYDFLVAAGMVTMAERSRVVSVTGGILMYNVGGRRRTGAC